MAEIFNRTIASSARASLFDSVPPISLWAEVVTHAAFTKSRIPHVSLGGNSPLEVLEGKKPHLARLQPFGSPTCVFILVERRKVADKLKQW
jgi:hypothetical protein